jgi:SAM-dependent methyltransferase
VIVCPQCRAALQPGTRGELAVLRCSGRHPDVAYPLVDGEVPLLLERPIHALARACLDLAAALREHDGWLRRLDDKLRASIEGSATQARLQRLRSGEAANRALFDRVYALLKRGLTAEDVLEAAALPASASSYGRDFNYLLAWLRRDFGGRPESERELATFEAALREELERHGHERGSALVLGAGLGRIAWGLRRAFPRVLAVDSSPAMAALFRLLSRGPLRFTELNLNNARVRADQAIDVEAALPPAPDGSRLEYAIADAAQLPVADRSQAAVVSLYFTDVVPLSRLGPELSRVLAPGGVFVHVGPLAYHFSDVDEQVAADELAQRLAGYGFDVTEPRVVTNTLLKSSALLDGAVCDNVVFSGVRI